MYTAVQWNARSITNKKSELAYFSKKYNPIMFAIAETWLKPQQFFKLPGYFPLRDDRVDGWDGSALLIKNNIPFSQIQLPARSNNIFIVAAYIYNVSYVSVYIPHPSTSTLSEFYSIVKDIPKPVVIMGDLNCHHVCWGSGSTDSNGRFLLDISDKLNLCCLNNGRPTRRTAPNQNSSAVDLSFCSIDLATDLTWSISSLSHNSDHFPIFIALPGTASPHNSLPPLQKYNLDKADWDNYSCLLDNKIQVLSSNMHLSLNNTHESFVDVIHESAEGAIPLKKTNVRHRPSQPWWDSECSAAIKERNAAEYEYANNINIENYIIFKKARAKCRKVLSAKKSEGWNSFCESISPSTPPSLVWKNIRRFRRGISPSSPSGSSLDWTNDFLNKLAPPTAPNFNEIPTVYSFIQSEHFLEKDFDLAELKTVLDAVKDSSPGFDGIVYSFLKKAGPVCHYFFLNLVNNIFKTGDIPDSWKHQIILPILKPGKDPEHYNSYRPIALSSVLCKLVEHMIKNRLEWFVENTDALAVTQFGFRKGRSVTDSHALLSTDIRLAFSQKQAVVGVFLDVTAAYDNVLLSVLSSKLRHMSIPEKVVRFISNLLSGRKISLRFHNYQDNNCKLVWKGLPQGSVLSPLLYSIYTADLDQAINQHCNVLQYADDIAIYSQHKNVNEAAHFINNALNSLGLWLDAHGLDLSPSKSVAIVFSRNRVSPSVNISFRSQSIPVEDKAKFLGVTFDSKLSGAEHINSVVGKCEKNLNIIRALSGAWWGAHPYSQKLLYNALVRSHLDFGSIIIEPCNKAELKKLDMVQSKALRMVTGAMKSSPVRALQVECADPPLSVRRQYLADRYLFRIAQLEHHPIFPKLNVLSDHVDTNPFWLRKSKPNLIISLSRLSDIEAPLAKFPKIPIYIVPFSALTFQSKSVDIGIQRNSASVNDRFLAAVRAKWQDWDLLYTDASKLNNNGLVGCAFIHDNSNSIHKFQLPSICSIFTGECYSILKAIQYVNEHKLTKSVIFTDSLSSIQAITYNSIKNCAKSPLICLIKEALFSCYLLQLEVVLSWIPSHKGIHGNEEADKAARDAGVNGNRSIFQCFSKDLDAISSLKLFKSWSDLWVVDNKLHYYQIQRNISPRPWFFKFKFKKKVMSSLIRLRLGHVCSPEFLFKIKVKDSAECQCGYEVGSIDHIFFECPLNRFCLYDYLIKLKVHLPTNAKALLANSDPNSTKALAVFLDKNKIKS